MEDETAVGVPLMVPVVEPMDSPEGSVGEMEYESTVPVPYRVGETDCMAVPTDRVKEFGE